MVVWSGLLISIVLASGPAESHPPEGPVAVLALVTADDEDMLARLAAAVQQELQASKRIEVIAADPLARLLSRGGAPLRASETQERLSGIFQQGYLQSYSFEYRKALDTLKRVSEGLERLPSSPERWKLWVKTRIFSGICLAGLKDEPAALQAFATVLRTRPDLNLSRREYSPKTIQLWEKARKRLLSLPRGSLAVESDPAGAKVMLDGKEVGTTPFIGRYYHGQYHLHVIHPGTGGAVRWVQIEDKPARFRFQLSFEGALRLDNVHPCVRLPAGRKSLPDHWWPWLGDRLGLRFLVVVRRIEDQGRPYLTASLVDLERGRRLREASLELAGTQDAMLKQAAVDLSDFLVTGKAAPSLKVEKLPQAPQPDMARATQQIPELPIHYAPRPWYRSWWPYAAAGGAALALGIGSHLASDHYQREADNAASVAGQKSAQDKADTWMGVAIAGYAVAGAAAVTALIIELTYEPVEVFPGSALVPSVGPGQIGFVLVGEF